MFKLLFFSVILLLPFEADGEDGYRLWLRYDQISEPELLDQYTGIIKGWIVEGSSPVLMSAGKELKTGLEGLPGQNIPQLDRVEKSGIIIAGTPESSKIVASLKLNTKLASIGDEGTWRRAQGSGRRAQNKIKIFQNKNETGG